MAGHGVRAARLFQPHPTIVAIFHRDPPFPDHAANIHRDRDPLFDPALFSARHPPPARMDLRLWQAIPRDGEQAILHIIGVLHEGMSQLNPP